ncbi:PAS domain-containing protein [Arcticibacter tournemirensis]|uniref:histidine kinase n=1 Tax=Arcticibacter tournemirensis TaxID=699437 RepID=A0A4Q0M8H7_9SPHI|nr:PAS domain S-box protein [Arcticibacter tournemirensis]RXF69026.1 PAS domain S-box protein [Arcticibacter tournemirensis]
MKNQCKTLAYVKDAIWSFDVANQKFEYLNERFANLYELSLDELERAPFAWRRLVHPDDYYLVKRETEKVYNGESVEIEFRIIVNGITKWLSDKKTPVLDDNQNVTMIVGITSDITTRKEKELEMARSEYIYRYFFVNNPNPLWIYDIKTLKFLAVNHATIEKYGYSEEEFLKMTIADIRPREDVSKLVSEVKKVKNRFYQSEGWRHINRAGKIMYVNISGHGIEYEGKKAELVMIHDVTAEVKNKEEIIIAKRNLDTLINNINDLIWSVDQDYRLISANASFERLTTMAFNRKLMPGESVLQPRSGDESIDKWKGYYSRVLKGESVVFINVSSAVKGSTFEIRMRPIVNEDKVIGVVCVGRDIQKRLDAEKRMILQNTELKEIVSLASHEIRGPVTSLTGLVNLFNKDNLSDPFNSDVISLIQKVTNELDTVIHKIVEKSYSIQVDNEAIYSSPQNLSDYE